MAPTKKRPSQAKPRLINGIKVPRPGTKSEAILTLVTTTPATNTEVAESVGCDKALVTEVLARYGINKNECQSFKKHRADILAGLQEKLLSKLNACDVPIEKAKDVRDMATAMGIVYDKERLENNLSTANVANAHSVTPELGDLISSITGKSECGEDTGNRTDE